MRVALFVPCFVDQCAPHAAIAALRVLERLGCTVDVPANAACCGQPLTNSGYAHDGDVVLDALARHLPPDIPLVVLSGSCALHLATHAGRAGLAAASLASRTVEFSAFLHDHVGLGAVRALGATCHARAAVHVGCHALRGLALAPASEHGARTPPPRDVVRALLHTVAGLSLVPVDRPDECCGFGGSFSVTEPAVSVRMGADRLQAMRRAEAQAIITTDLSCGLHLQGVDRATTGRLPIWHVAEVLCGVALPGDGEGTSSA